MARLKPFSMPQSKMAPILKRVWIWTQSNDNQSYGFLVMKKFWIFFLEARVLK